MISNHHHLRVAVVGAGSHSQSQHLPALFELSRSNSIGISLSAVCDPDLQRAEQAASAYGLVPCFADIEEALSLVDIDGIICVTPAQVTAPLACKLLPRKIPLLIEKPPGISLAQAEELEARRSLAGIPVMVSLNRRHMDSIKRLKQFVELHPGGRLEVHFLRKKRMEAGFFYDVGLHILDTLFYLCGRIDSWDIQRLDRLHDRSLEFKCQFESGAVAKVLIDPVAGQREETYSYSVQGLFAVARVGESNSPGASDFQIWKESTVQLEVSFSVNEPDFRRMGTRNETMAFIDLIRGDALPSPSLSEVLPQLAIVEELDLCAGNRAVLASVKTT